jgi:hypothetical protein
MSNSDLLISIDWLQLHLSGSYQKTEKYTYKLLNFSTRIFGKIEEIYRGEIKLGTIAYAPLSNILRQDCHIIKFDNKFLYFDYIFPMIDEFIADHLFVVKSITRLDLAIDFNTFLNNLHPENLILKFMNNEYLKIGRCKYKLIGEQFKKQSFQYLRFGANTAEIAVYLYNKSVEMKQKTFKQYIYNKWEDQKLDTDKDIWRLEFSIKTNRIQVQDKDTGELLDYCYGNLKSYEFITNLFHSLLHNNFRFVQNNGLDHKERMKPVILFNNIRTDLEITHVTRHEDNGRMDKIFLKMIENFNCELRNRKLFMSEELEEEIINYANKKRLEGYYWNRIYKDDKIKSSDIIPNKNITLPEE